MARASQGFQPGCRRIFHFASKRRLPQKVFGAASRQRPQFPVGQESEMLAEPWLVLAEDSRAEAGAGTMLCAWFTAFPSSLSSLS